MQAIILAAGMGKRLKGLTKNNTKCMIKVNGVTLIDRMLHQLDGLHLSRIVIVVGYKGKKLIDYVDSLGINTPIIYINNQIYNKTNNIYSLSLAKDWLCKENTLLFESDLIFEDSVLQALISDPRETLALVDKFESWMDGTCVRLTDDDRIEAFVPPSRFKFNEIKDYYKTVNIYKFSKHFSESVYVPFLEAYLSARGLNEYYEQVLRVITVLDNPTIRAKRLNGQHWYEIDDIQDLDIAESIFVPDEDIKVRLMQQRFGGYWRYPKLVDFSYLVNPFYPPENLKDEIKANFETLLMDYPSGMKVNALLAAKDFSVEQENIVIGNGASELIKALMEHFTGRTGFIRPTFDEYPHRYNDNVFFEPDNRDFSYTADDLMSYFEDKDIENLIVVNPDNPSGNYIYKDQTLQLIQWAKDKNIKLIIDESFVDFAEETNGTLVSMDILEKNPHLYVIKSISKSHGVPGLRLGILASGDKSMIEEIKKDVAIWNINSFGEFYMQIAEKYKRSLKLALEKLIGERKRLTKELSSIPGVRVIPSQANFLMIELENNISSEELLKRLLVKHNLLIKDLKSKTKGGNYLRIAVRNEEDNNSLIKAFKIELDQK